MRCDGSTLFFLTPIFSVGAAQYRLHLQALDFTVGPQRRQTYQDPEKQPYKLYFPHSSAITVKHHKVTKG